MNDKPISQEVMREAERLLPCNERTTINQDWCAERYRPAVAHALQARDDKLSEAQQEIAKLRTQLLVGTNHLEGIDMSGPGRKRMQSARGWYITVRRDFNLGEKDTTNDC